MNFLLRKHVRIVRALLWLAMAGLGLASLMSAGGLAQDQSKNQDRGHAALLTVSGPIGPAVADYLHRGIEHAVDDGATVVILQMDTPGGLDTSMREIIQDILASPIPVIGFVGPSGSRAASAGTYMLYATHLAAMAPATNLGAATPVQIGGGDRSPFPMPGDDDEADQPEEKPQDGDMGGDMGGGMDGGHMESEPEGDADGAAADGEDEAAPGQKPGLEDKALNDAVAYIRSLAQRRGRNVEWAEKAVTEAASLSAADALEKGVIELMADNVTDLLDKADGRTVEIAGEDIVLKTAGLEIVAIDPDWRTELLEVITNPTVAYLLLTIGVQALLLEFYAGTIIAGVVGGICLILGLYGLHVLPVDYAGLGLIVLGLALLMSEAFVPSFGILGIGGLIAFIAGSIMLLDTDVPGYGISPWLIGSIAAAGGSFVLLIVVLFSRARSRPVVSGREQMVGGTGTVVDWSDDSGRIRIHGEIWRARGDGPFEPGGLVRVREIKGLTLFVEPEAAPAKGN